MYRFLSSLTVTIAVLCMLCGCATAQNNPNSLVNCSDPSVANFPNLNISDFDGTWYEVARSPSNDWNCVEIDISNDTSNVYINVTAATNPNVLNLNITMNATLPIPSTTPVNYTLQYSAAITDPITFKVLDTDYVNYATICGFTDKFNSSTYFGVVLARSPEPVSLQLANWTGSVIDKVGNFTNMAMLIQSDKCHTRSGATTTVPAFVTMFATLLAVLKYFY